MITTRAIALTREQVGRGWSVPAVVAEQVLAELDRLRARVAELETQVRILERDECACDDCRDHAGEMR